MACNQLNRIFNTFNERFQLVMEMEKKEHEHDDERLNRFFSVLYIFLHRIRENLVLKWRLPDCKSGNVLDKVGHRVSLLYSQRVKN